MKALLLAGAVVSLLGPVAACHHSSEDGSSDAGVTDAGPPDAGPVDINRLSHPWAIITTPTGRSTLTTTESTILIGGPGYADEVTWTSDRGAAGATTASGHWEATVPLELGDNVIAVAADATGVSDTLTVTRNAYLAFAGPVELAPRSVFVNDATSVTFRVSIPYSDEVSPMDLVVVRLDDNHEIVAELCHPVDDGSPANGDFAAGDLEYSCIQTFDETQDGEVKLRVVVDSLGPNGSDIAKSEIFTLEVVRPLTQAEGDRVVILMEEAGSVYDQAQPQGEVAAASATVAWLASQPDVQGASHSADGFTVWWELVISGGRALLMGMGGGPPGTRSNPQISPAKGLVLEPFYAEWEASGDQISESVQASLQQVRCPTIDPIHVINRVVGGSAGVEEFKTMGDYGLVTINSHGTRIEEWIGGVPVPLHSLILTEQIARPEEWVFAPPTVGKYAADVLSSPVQEKPARLILWRRGNGDLVYAITSSFVDRYLSFDRAIVFNGACNGMDDLKTPKPEVLIHALAIRFLKVGAAVYVGFYGPVKNNFGGSWVKHYVRSLVDGRTAGPAFHAAVEELGQECPLPGGECEAAILYNNQDDWYVALGWDCDGYWRRQTVTQSEGYSYSGVLEVQHRIRQGEAGKFGALELRAFCRVNMYSRMEIAPGVYHYLSYSGVGAYEQVFVDEPLPQVFGIETDQTAVTFYSGAFPDDGSWVHRADSSSLGPGSTSRVDCDIPREVYEVYGTVEGDATITQDHIEGEALLVTSGGGTVTTKFEYRLQP